jgi:hypothetical protein
VYCIRAGSKEEGAALRAGPRSGDIWSRGLSVEWFGGSQTALVVTSVVAYMSVSTALNLITSGVVRSFELPATVTAIQMLSTVAAVLVLVPYTIRGTWRAAARWAMLVPVLFGGSLVTSALASSQARFGTVMIFRYVGPVISLGVEAPSASRCVSRGSCARVSSSPSLATFFGILVYVARREAVEASLDSAGYVFAAINLLVSVAETLVVRRLLALERIELSFTAMVLLNNGLGVLVQPPVLLCEGEHLRWNSSFGAMSSWQTALLVVSCVLGTLIAFTNYNLAQHVSATSLLVVANVDKSIALFASMALFPSEAHTPLAIIGVSITLCGAALYTWGAYRVSHLRPPRPPLPGAKPSEASLLIGDAPRVSGVGAPVSAASAAWMLGVLQQMGTAPIPIEAVQAGVACLWCVHTPPHTLARITPPLHVTPRRPNVAHSWPHRPCRSLIAGRTAHAARPRALASRPLTRHASSPCYGRVPAWPPATHHASSPYM